MKGKGFVDVTKGVNSVQGSTLVLDEDLLRACCCSWLASACCGSAGGSRHREGIESTTRPLLPCNSEGSRREGRFQQGETGRGNKGNLGTGGSPAAEKGLARTRCFAARGSTQHGIDEGIWWGRCSTSWLQGLCLVTLAARRRGRCCHCGAASARDVGVWGRGA